MTKSSVKAILGYTIIDGITLGEYDHWLWKIHYPDLLANPYLERIVLNTVARPITSTSAGTDSSNEQLSLERIAELHFADHEAYEMYLQWFDEHPIPVERSPAGRTNFRFYVLCDVQETDRTSR
ncbi:MAG: hypothetical protein ACC654_00130 [Acidimicrobiia bacterium]